MIKQVTSFAELLNTRFVGETNALCWSRSLPGDYAEVIRLLGPGEGVVSLDEGRLRSLKLTAYGLQAVEVMLQDLHLLRDAGKDPVLNIIYAYPRDEEGGPVPTDVLSWHVDSAPIEADTWLCTYAGACSEGLLTKDALRKIDDPALRAQLLELYCQENSIPFQVSGFSAPVSEDENRGQTPGGQQAATASSQVSAFEAWLSENHYDLHYSARPDAQPYSFGLHNLWRVTCAHPGNAALASFQVSGFSASVSQNENRGQTPGDQQDTTVSSQLSAFSPPCVHRAPLTDSPRLLLIS